MRLTSGRFASVSFKRRPSRYGTGGLSRVGILGARDRLKAEAPGRVIKEVRDSAEEERERER